MRKEIDLPFPFRKKEDNDKTTVFDPSELEEADVVPVIPDEPAHAPAPAPAPAPEPAPKKEEKVKDSYELAYEEQLRKFTELDSPEDTQPVPVVNVMGRDYEQHPNLARRRDGESSGEQPRKTRASANNSKGGSKKGKGSKKKRKGAADRTVHIDRGEPLKFGMSRQNAANGEAAVKKKTAVWKKVLLIILIIILVLFLALQLLILRYINKVTYRETGTRNFTTASLKSDHILNILVIGSDSREDDRRGRTDTMILMSIDKEKKLTTMTSFMRDSYVTLPDYDLDGDGAFYGEGDKCKLNAAYVYGGPELLMDTIEYNFDVAVDKYIYIDFYSFIDIIDAVDGIELDITDEEAKGMQDPMREQNRYLGNPKGTDYLEKGGKGLHVNGNQALGYARLRYIGNADFQRTERQRTVISKLIDKAKGSGLFTLDKFAVALCSHIETNMGKWDVYKLIYRAPFIIGYETKQLRIPGDDEFKYGTAWDGSSVLAVDLPAAIETINREIYE
ncbi:MAG: LCP family protein [Ruminococcus sp.]|nr:LCP family protein [Ruminococcus sp.]